MKILNKFECINNVWAYVVISEMQSYSAEGQKINYVNRMLHKKGSGNSVKVIKVWFNWLSFSECQIRIAERDVIKTLIYHGINSILSWGTFCFDVS